MCHKRWSQAQNPPGAPVPPDPADGTYISPNMIVKHSAFADSLPAGTPITIPGPTLEPFPIQVSEFDQAVADFSAGTEAMEPKALGALRVSLLLELASLPDNDETPRSSVVEAIAQTAVLAWQAVGALALKQPRLTILWNQDLNPETFIGRTILLADHVLSNDRLQQAIGRPCTNRELRSIATAELKSVELVRSGRLISVPAGVALAQGHEQAFALTKSDLANAELTGFVRSQLVLEGPTAREALIVNAVDDFERAQKMWFFARVSAKLGAEAGDFEMKSLSDFDPKWDYQPWIRQVTDSATRAYVQRTAERMTVADLIGAEYVASSPFEARLLARRSSLPQSSAPAAAIWADVPVFSDLQARDLVKMLDTDQAVGDLRAGVRQAMGSQMDLSSQIDALQSFTADIDRASIQLERSMRTNRAYSAIAPGFLGLASVVIGSAGGLPGVAGAALATVSGLIPYLGSRRNSRRDASYLFVMARRRQRKRHQ